MSTEEKTLQVLSDIKHLLASGQSDYCETDEACRILGLNNNRYLTQLFKRELLPRYPRAEGFRYKKTDLYKIAAALDTKIIILEPIIKRK